ncbi:MAG: PG0541 family transporter-associated protein [Desulfonatronovibrio sp.]
MKFVHISFRFEYTDFIDTILDKHEVSDYVRYPMVEGKGADGKHFGSQVFPGNFTVVQAMIDDDRISSLFEDLDLFRQRNKAHQHLRALVLPIEQTLGC